MDEYLLLIAITTFLLLAVFLIVRAKKGKKLLKKHLEKNGVNWIDIHWVVSKMGKTTTLGSLSILYEVILKSGQIERYIVGSWWCGLLNPEVRKIG